MTDTSFEVHFQHGDCERRLILQPGDRALIGRSPDAHFFLCHGSVSRRHCELICHDFGVEFRDLRSRNGCFANGQRIDSVFLDEHNILQVGRLAFSVWVTGPGDQPLRPQTPLSESKQVRERLEELLDAEGFHVENTLEEQPLSLIASHPEFENKFLIRAILLRVEANSGEFERFRKQARQAAGLEHPNIVRLLDVRSVDDMLYVLMDYSQGKTLRHHVEAHGPMPPDQALACVRALIEALRYTSRQKIYHHYLTPDMVFIEDDGTAKILDFRILQHFELMAVGLQPDLEVGGFIAPEVFLESLDADARADLYSVAALLHFMLTGRGPYDNATSLSIARAAMLRIPLMPDLEVIDSSLQPWLKRCLSLDVSDRPQDVEVAQKMFDDAAMNMLMPETGTPSRYRSINDSAFSGPFLGAQLLEVLQILEIHGRTGTLEVIDDEGHAPTRLTLAQGTVVDARCGSSEGSEAIKGLLLLKHGTFYFEPHKSDDLDVSGKTWKISSLLVETQTEETDFGGLLIN